VETNDPANSSPPEPSLPAVDTHTHQSRPNWRVGIGVRGGWAGGTCPPPPKKKNFFFAENTKKMKIARNCENSHLPRSFRKWAWGGGRVSSSCRPLSGKSAFCRERKSILSEQKTASSVIYRGVFGYGMGRRCRLVGRLSGKSAFVGNDPLLLESIRADHS